MCQRLFQAPLPKMDHFLSIFTYRVVLADYEISFIHGKNKRHNISECMCIYILWYVFFCFCTVFLNMVMCIFLAQSSSIRVYVCCVILSSMHGHLYYGAFFSFLFAGCLVDLNVIRYC